MCIGVVHTCCFTAELCAVQKPIFLLEQYGYRHDWIGWAVVVLATVVVLFWGLGAVAFKVLHFRH